MYFVTFQQWTRTLQFTFSDSVGHCVCFFMFHCVCWVCSHCIWTIVTSTSGCGETLVVLTVSLFTCAHLWHRQITHARTRALNLQVILESLNRIVLPCSSGTDTPSQLLSPLKTGQFNVSTYTWKSTFMKFFWLMFDFITRYSQASEKWGSVLTACTDSTDSGLCFCNGFPEVQRFHIESPCSCVNSSQEKVDAVTDLRVNI